MKEQILHGNLRYDEPGQETDVDVVLRKEKKLTCLRRGGRGRGRASRTKSLPTRKNRDGMVFANVARAEEKRGTGELFFAENEGREQGLYRQGFCVVLKAGCEGKGEGAGSVFRRIREGWFNKHRERRV